MRLSNVDLNLFAVFDAIYTERNLTRASKILFVTQPAVSNALKRLRLTFNDPLFIRTPHGVAPTPVAENVSPAIKQALHLLNASLIEGEQFVPASSSKLFSFSVHDSTEALLVPKLMHQLATLAPSVSIECFPVSRKNVARELASGELDFALDIPLFSTPQLCRQHLGTERYVCMLRPDHPDVGSSLSLEQYLDLEHIHVSGRRRGIGHVDMALERLGRQRKIRLRMKNYMAGPQIVRSTNLALTIPRNAVPMPEMKTLELPFNVEPLSHYLYWHKSADQDQASIWMRRLILGLFNEQVVL